MKSEQQVELQKQIIEYFKDVDDKTIRDVIESFVYFKGSNNNAVGELIQKFLKDNGLTMAFVNYCMDMKRVQNAEQIMFYRSSGSERDMIENIKVSLLNLAYNRFSALVDKIKPEPVLVEPSKVKVTYKDGDSNTHVLGFQSEYTLCGNIVEGSEIAKTDFNPKSKVNCPHCLEIIKKCKKMKV